MAKVSAEKKTLKEFGRGIIGGLLFSLPLVYTMEVWWAGFLAPPSYQLSAIVVTFLLLLGYNRYAGMKKDSTFWEVCWDSVEEIGLAFVVSFLFLLLISRIDFGMSFDEIAGKVIIESMVVAIGISVGTAQLGSNGEEEDEKKGMDGDDKNSSTFMKHIVLTICGSVLFASSVAPTEEIQMIAVESETIDLLLMVLVSLFLSFVILYFSDFTGTKKKDTGWGQILLHLATAYLIALIVSVTFLWFFGRIQDSSVYHVISQTIVLAIPAGLGGSAGRFLIQG